jgi:hypothetical protein
MNQKRAGRYVAAILVAGAFVLGANMAMAVPTFDFVFTGQCDDCAFIGDPGDPNFDALDDGLFEQISGTLRLTDITLSPAGVIDVSSSNFHSFEYDGSNLLNAFTFTDPFIITGELSASGLVQSGAPLRIETSAGDFSNFCTALGEQVLAADGVFCDAIGIASFQLDSIGAWSIFGSEPFDVGVGGQLAPIPEPVSGALLVLGLLAAGFTRRRCAVNDKG